MRKRRAGFGGEDSGPPPMEFFKVTHSLTRREAPSALR
jgi:hypothetical protein